MRQYISAVEQGNPIVQFHLSEILYRGEGIPEDDEETFCWTEKSAENGYVEGQAG